jgi:hypothetical protein
MEEGMKIVYDNKDFNFSRFYLIFDDKYFPYGDWEDFYTNILWDWLQVLGDAETKNCCDFRLDFIDGDYYLLATKNQETVSFVGVYNHKAKTLLGEYEFRYVKQKVLDIVKEIIVIAKEHSAWNDNLDTLEFEYLKLNES